MGVQDRHGRRGPLPGHREDAPQHWRAWDCAVRSDVEGETAEEAAAHHAGGEPMSVLANNRLKRPFRTVGTVPGRPVGCMSSIQLLFRVCLSICFGRAGDNAVGCVRTGYGQRLDWV